MGSTRDDYPHPTSRALRIIDDVRHQCILNDFMAPYGKVLPHHVRASTHTHTLKSPPDLPTRRTTTAQPLTLFLSRYGASRLFIVQLAYWRRQGAKALRRTFLNCKPVSLDSTVGPPIGGIFGNGRDFESANIHCNSDRGHLTSFFLSPSFLCTLEYYFLPCCWVTEDFWMGGGRWLKLMEVWV